MAKNKFLLILIVLTLFYHYVGMADQASYEDYKFAKKLFKEKLYSQAAVQFQDFVSQYPDHYQADSAYYLIGYSYYLDNDYKKSIYFFHQCETALSGTPLMADRDYHLALSYQHEGETQKAIDLLMDIPKNHPLSPIAPQAVYQSFLFSYEKRQFSDALSIGTAYSVLFPKGEHKNRILLRLGKIHYSNGDVNQALNQFNLITGQNSYDTIYYEALYQKALILRQLGSYENALSDFSIIIKKNHTPFLPEALINTAEIQSLLAKNTLMEQTLGQFILKFPNHQLSEKAYRLLLKNNKEPIIIKTLHQSDDYQAKDPIPTIFLSISFGRLNQWDSSSHYIKRIDNGAVSSNLIRDYYLIRLKSLYHTGEFDQCESLLWELAEQYGHSESFPLWISQMINYFIDFKFHPQTIYETTRRTSPEKLMPETILNCMKYWYKNELYDYADDFFDVFKRTYYYHPLLDSAIFVHKTYHSKQSPIIPLMIKTSHYDKDVVRLLKNYFKGNNLSFIQGLVDNGTMDSLLASIAVNALEILYLEKGAPDSSIVGFTESLLRTNKDNEDLNWFLEKNNLSSKKTSYKTPSILLEKASVAPSRSLETLLSVLNKTKNSREISKCYYLLAQSYYQKKDFDNSLNYIKQYLKNPASSQYMTKARFMEILVKYQLKDTTAARIKGLNFLRKHPCHPQVAEVAEILMDIEPDSGYSTPYPFFENKDNVLFLAQLSLLKKDYNSAVSLLKQIPEWSSQYQRALFHLAKAYNQSGKARQAIEAFRAYLNTKEPPKKSEALHELIDIYFQQDLTSLVPSLIEQAKQDSLLGSEELFLLDFNELKYLVITEKSKKLKDKIKNLKKENPGKIQQFYNLMNLLAEKLIEDKELSQAEKIISEIREDDEIPLYEKLKADKTMGVLLINEKKYEEAIALLKSASDQAQEDGLLSEIYFSLSTANYYKKPRNIEAAIENYERILKLNSPNLALKGETYFNLGMLYEEMKDYNKAIKQYRGLINEYPDHSRKDNAVFRIGFCYYSAFRYTEAILTYRARLPFAEGKDAAELHFYLGDCYRKSGEDNKAIVEFLKVAYNYSMYPMFAVTSLYMVGEIYQTKGDMEKAVMIYNKIVKKYGSSSQYGEMAAQRLKELAP